MTDTPISNPASTPPASTRPRRTSETDEDRKARRETDKQATRTAEATMAALGIAHRVTEAGILCPKCGDIAPKGKFKIHSDGGWKHFGSAGCSGDGIGVLTGAGISFGDAVNVLLGRPTREDITVPDNTAALAAAFLGTRSTIDIEVNNGVLNYGKHTGGIEAAAEFYGRWHISAEAVAESGAVLIADTKAFEQAILGRFGAERLLAAGLFTRTVRGDLFCMLSENFPVVEPHRHPATGDVLYMQFRASHAQHLRYLQHKAGEREYKGSEKILSLKGAPPAAQVGAGLDIIDKLPPGQTIFIVEGFKDRLSARTMGLHAYGLPGTGSRPTDKICALLSRHTVLVAYDGDAAGIKARDGATTVREDGTEVTTEGLVAYLTSRGVSASAQSMPAELDVTDTLVLHTARGTQTGIPCLCATCSEFRLAHPHLFTVPDAS